MFRKRELTVQVNKVKKNKEVDEIIEDEEDLEAKVEKIIHIAERVAIKVFAGFCVYIILDTGRQVAVERSKIDHND